MGIRKKNSKETFTAGLTKALGELFSCSALRPWDTMEDLAHISLLTQEKQFKDRVMIPGLSSPNKTECPDTGLFIHVLWGPPRNSFSDLPLLPAGFPKAGVFLSPAHSQGHTRQAWWWGALPHDWLGFSRPTPAAVLGRSFALNVERQGPAP